MNSKQSINHIQLNEKIQILLKKLTIEEKAVLCSGKNFWETPNIDRLDIPSIWMSDGPYGLRKVSEQGFSDSVPATCFPTSAALASAWNTDLIYEVGQAIGKECQSQNIQILLGPGINIKRSPLGGRNFEYYSEDPLLAGELAAAFINGVQSQGVGTSLKHFCCNNAEYDRMRISVNADERTLRELYLTAFEIAVKKAQPWAVMASYNKVNGVYVAENKYLLTEILRKEWDFKGIIISDWGAVNNRINGIKAGLDMEMPYNPINNQEIIRAINEKTIAETALDDSVSRNLAVILKAAQFKRKDISISWEEHHALARRVAEESIVLLRNHANILPIDRNNGNKIAIIGEFAKKPRFQGGGSAQVHPTQMDNAYDEIIKLSPNSQIVYAPGYTRQQQSTKELLIEAAKAASESDLALVFAGLPDDYEAESCDRQHMQLPQSHIELIEIVAAAQPNTVVVLQNGSPVDMSKWYMKVKGIVETWLGGQGGGRATSRILFGEVNPSGKLPETFPCRLEDNPSFLNFPGNTQEVNYAEGIFVGYRYYEKIKREVLFPFGYGLSYTSFKYSGLSLDKKNFTDTEQIVVRFNIKNSGKRFGKEIVQLYIHDKECYLPRPHKELKRFE